MAQLLLVEGNWIGLHVAEAQERDGLDAASHGERGYTL